MCETGHFGSSNLTILKKKSKNTRKYHNIFTISSFLDPNIYIYIFERNATFMTFVEQILNDKLLFVLNW